jgi:hypothetical protein
MKAAVKEELVVEQVQGSIDNSACKLCSQTDEGSLTLAALTALGLKDSCAPRNALLWLRHR